MPTEITPHQKFCVVRSCTNITDQIYRLIFEWAELAATVQPGQFVNIRVSETEEPLLRRPFSVSRVEGAFIERRAAVGRSGAHHQSGR